MGQRLGTNDVGYDASRLNTLTLNTIVSPASVDAITDLTGDVIASGPGIVGATLRIPITIPDPAVTSGDGVFIKHTATPFSVAVPAGNALSLIDLNFKNTGLATSQFYGLKIQTDSDVVDTGAGVAIFNAGRADSIYINAAGKSGNALLNTPTGIGIDLNKEIASSGERSSANGSHQGIQIFDWSTTDQGIGGPRGILLLKIANLNTEHLLMSMVANRNMLQMVVTSGDAGYVPTAKILSVSDATTPADWWQIRADASQVFNKDGTGIHWVTPGGTAYIMASSNDLKLKSGGSAIRFVNQADTDFGILMQDNLDVIMGLAGSTSATHGFPHMPAAAGIPAGSPTTYAGWQPYTFDTTNNDFYVFNAGWKKVGSVNGVTGTSANTRLAFWTGTTTVGGDADLVWDNTNKRFGLGVASPTVRADLLDTLAGTYATSATPQSYIFTTSYTSASNITDATGQITVAQFTGGINSNANIHKFYEIFSNPSHNGSGHIDNLFAAVYEPANNSNGTISNLFGFIAQPIQNGTGLIDALYGFQASPAVTNTGNVTLLNSFIATYSASAATTIGYSTVATIGTPSLTGGAAVTNSHTGLLIQDQRGIGSTSYALATQGGIVAFDNGNVGIRSTTPQNVLEVLPGDNAMISVGNGYVAASGHIVGIHLGYLNSANLGYRKTALVYEGTGDGSVRGKFHILMNNIADSSSASLTDSVFTVLSDGNIGHGVTAPTAVAHLAASSTARASLRIESGTAPTSPNDGDLWNDSTQKTVMHYTNGLKKSIVGTLFTQTADQTVANTVTETTLLGTGIGTITLPANYFVAGKTIRIRMFGYFSTSGNPNIQFKVKYGSTVLIDSGAFSAGNGVTNHLAHLEARITCRTTGATGTVFSQGEGELFASHGSNNPFDMETTSATTINTTTSNALDVTVTWGTASAGNTITTTNVGVEVLN